MLNRKKNTMTMNDGPVRGHIELATPAGFLSFLEKASESHRRGYVLVSVINVGPKHIAGIFQSTDRRTTAASLLGD